MITKREIMGLLAPMPVFEKINSDAFIPVRGSSEAAGLDLFANEYKEVPVGHTVLVKTGLKCSFNPGWAALIWDRSGWGFKGIHRYAGVIDSDYRGEWGVVLHNSTHQFFSVEKGDRIAQVVFQRVWIGKPKQGTVIEDTARGRGGFGSTGNR